MFGMSCTPLSVARLEERALEETAHDDPTLHFPYRKIPVPVVESLLDDLVACERRDLYRMLLQGRS
jgi:hypothetical protein